MNKLRMDCLNLAIATSGISPSEIVDQAKQYHDYLTRDDPDEAAMDKAKRIADQHGPGREKVRHVGSSDWIGS